ncbi:MAG: hypothetical protein IJI87_07510 [Mogibacterium sp.]|nr:hypothetical protein [Mogibacterium sp.]
MSNKTYDRIKWFALVFIPAFEVFILTIGKIWAIPYYSEIGATVAAVGVFLAAVIDMSSKEYYRKLREEGDDDSGEDGEKTEGEDR